MKTITIGELFTEEQLRQAAAVFQSMEHLTSPHDRLRAILEPDKPRFDQLEVDLSYAAYLLEAHRNMIIHAYS